MDIHVDRTLHIPIHQQLKGMIEYAIAFGELVVGQALPSVRDLAQEAGVAPMTVSQVYRALKRDGLVETRKGSGTFVADSSQARAAARTDIDVLHRQIDAVVDKALELGIRSADLTALVNARLIYRARAGRRASIFVMGLFPEATQSYANFIAERLGGRATVEPMTLEAARNNSELRSRIGSADLVVTFANRHGEVQRLLPNTKVATVRFIPSERTRMAFASISPMARVLAMSRFADFIPIFKSGVQRFAPHVHNLTVINYDDASADQLLADCDVVVYATGTEDCAKKVRPGTFAFEYRHTPDPVDVDRVVLAFVAGAPQPVSAEAAQ